jgi:hypothetical protein
MDEILFKGVCNAFGRKITSFPDVIPMDPVERRVFTDYHNLIGKQCLANLFRLFFSKSHQKS